MKSQAAGHNDSGLVWASAALIAIGTALRLRQYLFNRSLWFDETLLSLDIVNGTVADLLRPLDSHQASPVGFVLLEKLAVQVAGTSEYALRFAPLVAGVASLYLFFRVLRLY